VYENFTDFDQQVLFSEKLLWPLFNLFACLD